MQALYVSPYDYTLGHFRLLIDLPYRSALGYLGKAIFGVGTYHDAMMIKRQQAALPSLINRVGYGVLGTTLLIPVVNIALNILLRTANPKVKYHPNDCRFIKDPKEIQKKLSRAFTSAQRQRPLKGGLRPNGTTCLPHSETLSIGHNRVGFAETIGRRPTMEDAHIATNFTIKIGNAMQTVNLYGIFDGHGGSGASRFLANNLKHYLQKALKEAGSNQTTFSDADIFEALQKALVYADQAYDGNAGSTACVVMEIGGNYWSANVGDSRAVLKNGASSWPIFGYKAVNLSEDANPEKPQFKARVEKRGGEILNVGGVLRVNGLLAVAGAIGDHEIVNGKGEKCISPKPKLLKYEKSKINTGSHLIIACDGFWDVFTSSEAVKVVKQLKDKGMSETEIAQHLVKRAFELGSTDNISLMVVPL